MLCSLENHFGHLSPHTADCSGFECKRTLEIESGFSECSDLRACLKKSQTMTQLDLTEAEAFPLYLSTTPITLYRVVTVRDYCCAGLQWLFGLINMI